MSSLKHKQDHCPECCNKSLIYTKEEHVGDTFHYHWHCSHCHARGEEVYILKFKQHENVTSGKNNLRRIYINE